MRIGNGFDVHAFGPGDQIVLGGVSISHDRGLIAHSDGDVLVHAVMDALLGALALGDIGEHFPPSDVSYRNADSMQLLAHVVRMVSEAGFAIANIDCTIIAESPKMSPHICAMRSNIANASTVDLSAVSIKATTTEGLGFIGRGEGIAVQASALVQQSISP